MKRRNYHRYRYNRYYRLYQKVNALQKKRLADYSMQKMTECILFLVLGVCLLFLYQMFTVNVCFVFYVEVCLNVFYFWICITCFFFFCTNKYFIICTCDGVVCLLVEVPLLLFVVSDSIFGDSLFTVLTDTMVYV